VLGLGLMAAPALRGDAAETALNVSPGLWEYTSSMKGAAVPDDVMASLTPDQRAKVTAMLAKAMPHSYKVCITPEQVKNGAKLAQQTRPGCQRTVLSSTATQLELRDECTGKMNGTITTNILAPRPDTLSAITDIAMNQGGQTHKMQQELKGKWLSADCGDVKPGAVKPE
jgi:hypothetical protein